MGPHFRNYGVMSAVPVCSLSCYGALTHLSKSPGNGDSQALESHSPQPKVQSDLLKDQCSWI